MARLTSGFYVSHLLRLVSSRGGFAAIVRKGAEEAGAVHLIVRQRTGRIGFYRPAMQGDYDMARPQERLFELDPAVTSEEDLALFMAREARFDPDFWLVELEPADADDLPFAVTTP